MTAAHDNRMTSTYPPHVHSFHKACSWAHTCVPPLKGEVFWNQYLWIFTVFIILNKCSLDYHIHRIAYSFVIFKDFFFVGGWCLIHKIFFSWIFQPYWFSKIILSKSYVNQVIWMKNKWDNCKVKSDKQINHSLESILCP